MKIHKRIGNYPNVRTACGDWDLKVDEVHVLWKKVTCKKCLKAVWNS